MKNGKVCFGIALLGILLVIMIAPVSAATGTASISGTAQSYAAITVVNPTSSIPLSVGTNTDTGVSLQITTNGPFSITVADNTGRTNAGDKGYMGNYTTAYVAPPTDTILTNPMSMSGTTTTQGSETTTASTITPPVSAAQTLYTGSGAVTNQILPFTATQTVVGTDHLLPGTNTYRIDLLFTLTSM